MRVVLVSLARRGGMVHFLVELANALGRHVSASVVISDAVPDSYVDAGIQQIRMRTGNSALESIVEGLSPATWYRLWRTLSHDRPDLIHVTGVHAWNPAVMVLGKLLGKSLVYTLHDPEEHRGAPLSIRLSNWLATRLADRIVVLTEDGRRRLVKKGLAFKKIEVIPHGMYSFFCRWERRGIRPRKTILCFGRFEPYKDLQNLVAAFTRMRRHHPGWSLHLAGDGELPTFPGGVLPQGVDVQNEYVPDAGVARLMQGARFVVAPYTEASQSGVIAAAYAFGKPVIATAVGGLREMVFHGNTGLLVPPGNEAALARAMGSLAAHPERVRRMGKNARALGKGQLSWDRIAQTHVELYATLAARRDLS
jgi:alpha-maltose-1-phosphate synthase